MKRKASEIEEVTSWSHWSPSFEVSSMLDSSPYRLQDSAMPWARISKQQGAGDNHINLRTRKRVRDNRPEIETIHRNTLAKLFDAQRQTQPISQATENGSSDLSRMTSQVPAQKSLHSFFSIPQSRVPCPQPRTLETSTGTCEDCGNLLTSSSGLGMADVDMMDLSDSESNFACVNCHRSVCDTCSIRANSRLCLECALPGNG